MSDLIIEKVWQDGELIELKISAVSKYVCAYQSCYVCTKDIEIISRKIVAFSNDNDKECYLEFGKKQGNYTPAFSMLLLPVDAHGHMKIEVDLEIMDNNTRCHRCVFYIESEVGLIEKFGKKLKEIVVQNIGYKLDMNGTGRTGDGSMSQPETNGK